MKAKEHCSENSWRSRCVCHNGRSPSMTWYSQCRARGSITKFHIRRAVHFQAFCPVWRVECAPCSMDHAVCGRWS